MTLFLLKFLHYSGELCAYAVVAEVTDAAFVGVVYLAGGVVGVVLYLHAHLAVCFSEGDAREGEAVDVLYGEEVVVLCVAEDIAVDADML